MFELRAVGGYNEIGKNATAVKIGNDALMFDCGLHMENFIQYTEDEKLISANSNDLMKIGAVPDISQINDWRPNLRGILPSHAHLDHIGAIPYLAGQLKAPIMGTPFTTQVIRTILGDEEIKLKNPIQTVQPNGFIKLSNDVKAEFIHTTHSTPHSTMVALHTREGIILYSNDFKFDNTPVLGPKPNYKRLEELGKIGIKALIADSTNAAIPTKTPSEMVARQMLEDVLLGVNNKGKALIVTTFSSHIARLKSIVEMGKKLGRKVVFLGRSLHKYSTAAERVGLINFSKEVRMAKYRKQIKQELTSIMQKKGKYLMVVTGHQGEPGSTLSRMATGELRFKFEPEDNIVFSCRTIPTATNIRNRERLEDDLKAKHARLFMDIHASGHAAREDLRELINLTKPQNIIPSHGSIDMRTAFAQLTEDMGYTVGKNVHMVKDGDSLRL